MTSIRVYVIAPPDAREKIAIARVIFYSRVIFPSRLCFPLLVIKFATNWLSDESTEAIPKTLGMIKDFAFGARRPTGLTSI